MVTQEAIVILCIDHLSLLYGFLLSHCCMLMDQCSENLVKINKLKTNLRVQFEKKNLYIVAKKIFGIEIQRNCQLVCGQLTVFF